MVERLVWGQEVAGSNPVTPIFGLFKDFNSFSSVYSPIVQSAEHTAVNRAVVGSSPTRGACPDEGHKFLQKQFFDLSAMCRKDS